MRALADAIGRPKRIPALFVSRADPTPRPPAFPFRRDRPQLAAVLAADTGLGLAPWELKLFLKELDLGDDDRVSADRFCGIYTFLASRPPTPAAPPATAPSTEPVEAAAAAPAAPEPGVTTEPVVTTSVSAVPGDEAAKTREEPRTTDVQRTPIGVPFPPEFVLDPTGEQLAAAASSWAAQVLESVPLADALQGLLAHMASVHMFSVATLPPRVRA